MHDPATELLEPELGVDTLSEPARSPGVADGMARGLPRRHEPEPES